MIWFKQHSNWTIFLMWVVMIILLATAGTLNGAGFWFLYTVAVIGMLATLIWSLKVKNRSVFNIFYLFIPIIGFIIIFFLGKKKG